VKRIRKLLADDLLEEVDAPRGATSDDERRRYYRVTRRGRVAAETELRRMTLLLRLGRAFLAR
jgi:hypothetical protein